MKTLIHFSIISLSMLLFSYCSSGPKHAPERGTFHETNLTGKGAIVVADTVTYDAIIKNDKSADDWQNECLRNIDRKALSNAIFGSVYTGKLQAYDKYDSPMSIEEVKKLEADSSFARSKIGKMQFIEEWYYDDKAQKFGKRVNSIMFGYELYDLDSVVRGYQAGVKVFFNGFKPEE